MLEIADVTQEEKTGGQRMVSSTMLMPVELIQALEAARLAMPVPPARSVLVRELLWRGLEDIKAGRLKA